MTWPNTAISTTYLDAGSDRPSQARADIKLMADAVNAMITDKPMHFALLTMTGTRQSLGSPNPYRYQLSTSYDSSSIITLSDSNYRFSIASGTYYVTSPRFEGGSAYPPDIYNNTDSSTTPYYNWINSTILNKIPAGTVTLWTLPNSIITYSDSDAYEFRSDAGITISTYFALAFMRIG